MEFCEKLQELRKQKGLTQEELAEYFKTISFRVPNIPVVFNCLGDCMPEGESVPNLLVRQVQSSVYMEDSIRRMAQLGVDAFVEIGPGNALTGFVRRTLPGAKVYTVETVEDIEKLRKELGL